MEKSYTESEIRNKLSANVDRIARNLNDRLVDDVGFKSYSFNLVGKLGSDGTLLVSDAEPLRKVFLEMLGFALAEYTSEIFLTLFGEDNPSLIP